ncbi:MAG TPA: MarR family transcriptional regulator [Candidatus Dormibacteraeota bacterium]|nr:MarR family transcriptional regulator [Candidatus Dormibacteraeota bacterium]
MPGSVAQALFGSATLPRLLEVLATEPDRRFTTAELEARVRASHDSTFRALQRAVAAGLVVREGVGRQFVYRADSASPIFPEVKTLLSKLFGPASALRRALSGLGPPDVESAFLFGSAARAEDRLASDLDVFVVGDVSRFALSRQLADAERELGREVNAMAYPRQEVAARLAAGDGFLLEVWRQPKLMLVGDEEDLPDGR